MSEGPKASERGGALRVVLLYALGYLGCYVPYSALVKVLSEGAFGEPLSGLALLPLTSLASTLSMLVSLSLMGAFAVLPRRSVFGIDVPVPSPGAALSGLATALIIATTTLAYTFEGLSIPLAMVWMRASVLMVAPIVDVTTGHHVRRVSMLAVGLSIVAAITSVSGRELDGTVPLGAIVDLGLYVAAYVVRLTLVSRLAKQRGPEGARRFFYEEQLVATPALLVLLAALWLVPGVGDDLGRGLALIVRPDLAALLFVTGVLSQGAGFFGGLVLIDGRESSFTVPINRAASLIAGVLAGAILYVLGRGGPVRSGELVATAMLVVVIVLLARSDRRASVPNPSRSS